MSETLLTNSSIKLYGRVMTDLKYKHKGKPSGFNNFLLQQLAGRVEYDRTVTMVKKNGRLAVDDVANLMPGMAVVSDEIPEDAVIVKIDPDESEIVIDSVKEDEAGHSAADDREVNWRVQVILEPRFARIYAFSFEGAIYSLPKP